ncbi:MAG: hypothetical protein KF870_07310 [Leadbetterella sp.]|nr:hypothetical protein [Leadbetterella sp.]
MENSQYQDALEEAYQALEAEKQQLLNSVKDEAVEAIRCMISQLDHLHSSTTHLSRIFPDQQLSFGKAQAGLSIAKSYFSEALNNMIINPQTVDVSQPS